MKWLVLILLTVSFTARSQDTTELNRAYKLLIAAQQKEIDRQDSMIFLLSDSVGMLNKKVFALANINGTLKKKNNRQEMWFKIGNALVSGLILYFTSR